MLSLGFGRARLAGTNPELKGAKVRFRNKWDLPFALLIVPILLAGRAANIFPLSLVANRYRKGKATVTPPMQVVMWWSGLRGAVSFALAMTLDDSRGSHMVIP